MNKNNIYEVHEAMPEATIILIHMEGVNHNTLSRKEIKQFLQTKIYLIKYWFQMMVNDTSFKNQIKI
ncbi:hypothetical protein [Flavobacterium anhuiense]|uniref:hypothetical protein n=1 Tax=Flavobacterium anhuiense TaxID=459526 RepID=UPI000B84DBAA|nr:hypothetical protein [Flavobacterium anhuiense]